MNQLDQKILDYSKTATRNKIVFFSGNTYGFTSVNVGKQISEEFINFEKEGRLSISVLNKIEEILSHAILKNEILGSYLCIENIGILFEPELKLDFASLLDRYSQNNVLFVKWEGEIDAENIYFLTKENGIKINIKNLSHIVI
jgi:hypothetical protein